MSLSEVQKQALIELELMLEKVVDGPIYENLVDALKEEIKKVIPGEKYDGAADLIVPAIAPALRAALRAQIEKISPEV